ncbi:MAG: hypothetical protein EPN85_14670 [Bacteroidetes bacterium]|nr:MAG: hypothetical protein EPN85_14670 [Bacteroidota bacterium]
MFIALLLLICITYSNHFTNGFEFDDFHSIANNTYIRDIKNIPLFFTDIKYSGTNPGNQGYRPLLVMSNAIDYWLAGELDPVYFHAHIFLSYILLLILMFFLLKNIFSTAGQDESNRLLALLATAFFGVHTANAETINYICQRSDMVSTLWIIASLLLYMHPKARKYYLYVLTIALAIGSKETGTMCGPILFIYILFFEENVSLLELVTFKKLKNVFIALKKSLPALLASFGIFYLIRRLIIPVDEDYSLVASESSAAWQYFYTQWVVICHYLGNFVIPLDLSADPDFTLYESVLNSRVLLSLCLLLSLIFIAFVTSRKKETRPIAFGILWFFIALAPTSSILPFGQIANDHRTFFPYIGLVISLAWWLRLLYSRYQEQIKANKYLGRIFIVLYLMIISLHAYGTYQRNIVWSSSATLWHDATIKSPKNGRAQMNYGLTLMSAGKYEETLTYFKRTLELMPYWAYIHINMGVLREAMGFSTEAEQHFLNAIRFQPNVPDSYYYYARWLQKKDRLNEAIAQLQEGIRISPGHVSIAEYLKELSSSSAETNEEKIKRLEKSALDAPSVDNYINLSILYYRNDKFIDCIMACEKALELNPHSALAYNNMCSAYNATGQWEKAAAACLKALEIDSTFQLAKNNLKWAQGNLKK